MNYQIIKLNNGEKREFYNRLLGGTVLCFANTLKEARILRDRCCRSIWECDELSIAEIVKVNDNGIRLELIY